MFAVEIVVALIFIWCLIFMVRSKAGIPVGQISPAPLSGLDRLSIWIICLGNPLFGGLILFYGWRKKLPLKTRQLLIIWVQAFFVIVVVTLAYEAISNIH